MKFVANKYNKGEIIKIIREWTELTQKDFAESIKKSRRTVQDYESNKTNYNIDTLLDIAKKHNIKITFEKEK